MKSLFKKSFVLTVALLVSQTASAASPIPYQGHLTDVVGVDIAGTVAVEVRLYDSLIGGMGGGISDLHVIYAESHPAVQVTGGIFRIGVGDGTPLDSKWASLPIDSLIEKERAYLELWINGERLSPRQRLSSLPAALRVAEAKFVDDLDALPSITPDMIPNYSAERITSGTFSSSQIPNLDSSIIEGTLSASHIPTLNVSKFSEGGMLPTDIFGEYSATKITSGEIGTSLLPADDFLLIGDFAIGSGTLTHGQHLNLPSGFTSGQCMYVFTPTETSGAVEGIDCQRTYLNSSGNLICEVWRKSDCSGDKANCNALFMAVCKKEG